MLTTPYSEYHLILVWIHPPSPRLRGAESEKTECWSWVFFLSAPAWASIFSRCPPRKVLVGATDAD